MKNVSTGGCLATICTDQSLLGVQNERINKCIYTGGCLVLVGVNKIILQCSYV